MKYVLKSECATLSLYDETIKWLKEAQKCFFPGFFEPVCQCIDDYVEYHKEKIKIMLEKLLLSLDHLEEKEEIIVNQWMMQYENLVQLLHGDLHAAFEGDPAAADDYEIVLTYPGYFAVFVYRLAHELYRLKVPYLPRMMCEYAHQRTGIDIHPGAEIGAYFFIDHGTGVVIGETAKIGNHVRMYQGVTLGALSLGRGQQLKGIKRHPTIEDHVTIYSNSTILGGDTVIGERSILGSNTYITSSIEPSSIVIMKMKDLHIVKRK